MAASKKNTVSSVSTVLAFADDPLIIAYESLRGQFLGDVGGSRSGSGLALLLSRGMGEWIKACGHLLKFVPQRPAEHTHAEQPLPSGVRAEIVMVLSGMVLQHSQRIS
jgi:hypothetical protein